MAQRFDPNLSAGDKIRAVRDAYLMATPDKTDTAYAALTQAADAADDMLAVLQSFLPGKLIGESYDPPVSADQRLHEHLLTWGQLRAARDAVAKAAGQAVAK